jgi:tetratricopeptide (TPR) repeat protein
LYAQAFAPEYQGPLKALSVNSSYQDVLAAAEKQRGEAEHSGSPLDVAHAELAVAEACRRLGRVDRAERAWRASYRAAREAADLPAMAWALWSGGTLARQRGAFSLARRWLTAAANLASHGGDRLARGYALAGIAETGRIQGDYASVTELHHQLLAEAREHGEARHIVWALSGLAQIYRNTGAHDVAMTMFTEAAEIATDAGDARGRAWALRGVADIVSLSGEPDRALELLADAEETCRRMNLESALAYNHKMRGNVLYRAYRYNQAREVYGATVREFRAISEPRGEALAQLGLVKSLARMGRPREETEHDLTELHDRFARAGLYHARDMVERARRELFDEGTFRNVRLGAQGDEARASAEGSGSRRQTPGTRG